MLKKRLKHDFKGLSKLAFPLLLALVGAVAVGSLTGFVMFAIPSESDGGASSIFNTMSTIGSGTVLFLAFMAVFAVGVGISVMIFVDFYKSTASDEAYLTFTLPVKEETFLLSKLISSLAFSTATSIAMAAGFYLMILSIVSGVYVNNPPESIDTSIMQRIWEIIYNEIYLPGPMWLYYVLGFVSTVAEAIASQLLIFLAIFVGSTIANKAKVIVSIGFYVGFTTAYSIVTSVLQTIMETVSLSLEVTPDVAVAISCIFKVFMLIITVGLGVFCFYFTTRLMKKKLNLS